MSLVCPEDPDETFPEGVRFCIEHGVDLVAPDELRTEPERPISSMIADETAVATPVDRRRSWTAAVCWYCGTSRAHESNRHCQNLECRRRLIPPALFIKFPDGEIALESGQRVELGRLGADHKLFRNSPNVSRSHAVVGVTDIGEAWVRPEATLNGTFINGQEIPAAVDRMLESDDEIRFARDVTGKVTRYQR